jgi:hypothetical protein
MEHVCFEPRPVSSAALVLCLAPPLPTGRELLDVVDEAIATRLARPGELLEPAFDHGLAIRPPDVACV